MGSPFFLAASAITSAVSGGIGFLGSRQRAAAQEAQAERAALLGERRAAVTRNNAVARAQDERFRASVARFNQRERLQRSAEESAVRREQIEQRNAAFESRLTGQGLSGGTSFGDVLRSRAFFEEFEESRRQLESSTRAFEFGRRGQLAEARSNRALEIGRSEAALERSSGRFRAAGLRSRASATRTGGFGTLIGAGSRAAGTAARI